MLSLNLIAYMSLAITYSSAAWIRCGTSLEISTEIPHQVMDKQMR